jgi:hypothetical protein
MVIVFHAGYYASAWNPYYNSEGIGGTEQCIMGLSRSLALQGHSVFVVGQVKPVSDKYPNSGSLNYVDLKKISEIPEIDILIGVSYIHYLKYYNLKPQTKKIFWLHNEHPHYWYKGERMSDVDIQDAYLNTDTIVCLTNWHKEYFLKHEPFAQLLRDRVEVIGNGLDTSLFEPVTIKKKDSYIYTSHPERGLDAVISDIEKGYLDGTLDICTPTYGLEYYNENFSERVSKLEGVTFHGSLSNKELYKLMSKCESWYYPTTYNETYCLTAIEMLGHHVRPLVNPIAGLKETLNKFSKHITDWSKVDEYVKSRDWKLVAKEWEILFNKKESVMIQKVYVISMDTSNKKLKEYTVRLREAGIDCDVVIVPGVDARSFKEYKWSPHDSWAMNSDNKWWNQPVTVGEMGCGLAHLNTWKKIVQDQTEVALICEEDFFFKGKIDYSIIPDPSTWDMLYLGRCAMAPDRDDYGDIVVPGYSYNLHAYMVTQAGALSFTQHNFQEYITAADEFVPATYCVHPRGDWDWVTRDTRALALKEDIAFQSSNDKTSRTQSTVHEEIFKSGKWPEWVDKWIHPAAKTKAWDMIFEEPIQDVISYPLFTEEFCELLIDEAEQKALWQTKRHEFYPTVDTLISSFGYDEIYKRVLKEFVFPAAISRWHLHGKAWINMDSENFMIKYTTDTQGHLDLHHDNAVISSVLTLNKDYTGGGTYFYNQKQTHIGDVGHIAVHPGQVTHRHGGRPVHSGKRYILVSFCNKQN